MKNKIILSFTILIGFTTLHAQQVVVRQQGGSSKTTKRKSVERNVENYNAFKFDPLRMTIGELNFSWEKRIDDKVSVEFELGPTISNLGGNRFYFDSYNQYQINSRMGGLISAAVRYYPLEGSWAMNKLYISPRIKYRRFNSEYTALDIPLPNQAAYSNETMFTFNVGYQQWLSDNFAFDYYIGLGIGGYRATNYTMSSIYNGTTMEYDYSWKKYTDDYTRLIGVIGMKITIGN